MSQPAPRTRVPQGQARLKMLALGVTQWQAADLLPGFHLQPQTRTLIGQDGACTVTFDGGAIHIMHSRGPDGIRIVQTLLEHAGAKSTT